MDDKEKLWNGTKNSVRLRISFYGRQGRVQIGKDIVRILGAPPYVSIRVNKAMDSLLIETAHEKHKLAFKVPIDLCFNKDRQMFVSSKSFVIGIMSVNNLDFSKTFQIDGIYSEKNNAVVFNIKDAKMFVPLREK